MRHPEECSFPTVRKPGLVSACGSLPANAKSLPQEDRVDPFPHLPLCSGDTGLVLCLDYLKYGHLEGLIRTLQSTMSPGDSNRLEFTTLGPSVKLLSMPFILCALPFLPRRHVHPRRHETQRTSTPLLTSLHQIIGLATSGPSPFVIDNVRNVSEEYATTLETVVRELALNRQARSSFIDQWGMECWREHRFLTEWESGLLRAGHLMKWIVVVRK
jgi:hypothetical protein